MLRPCQYANAGCVDQLSCVCADCKPKKCIRVGGHWKKRHCTAAKHSTATQYIGDHSQSQGVNSLSSSYVAWEGSRIKAVILPYSHRLFSIYPAAFCGKEVQSRSGLHSKPVQAQLTLPRHRIKGATCACATIRSCSSGRRENSSAVHDPAARQPNPTLFPLLHIFQGAICPCATIDSSLFSGKELLSSQGPPKQGSILTPLPTPHTHTHTHTHTSTQYSGNIVHLCHHMSSHTQIIDRRAIYCMLFCKSVFCFASINVRSPYSPWVPGTYPACDDGIVCHFSL